MNLILQDGTTFSGQAFGDTSKPVAGELVFNTGMVGYPETLTDPSYAGQILVFTYPLIGNYGLPESSIQNELSRFFESNQIQVKGIVVSYLSRDHSHWNAFQGLDEWLKEHHIPGLQGVDTRALAKKLRDQGTQLAKLTLQNQKIDFEDPNQRNLVAEVSIKEPKLYQAGKKRVVLIDVGCKNNIIRSLLKRDISVLRVPWNYDFSKEKFDGLLISNGPGDPMMVQDTINNLKKHLDSNKPIFGICLGNQILALAAGAQTYKLKFGHRSQNQPCIQVGTKRCFITSQNHGYAVDSLSLPIGWKPWFFNANDGSSEGITHATKYIKSVQFHPEACPGPVDTNFLFDDFVNVL